VRRAAADGRALHDWIPDPPETPYEAGDDRDGTRAVGDAEVLELPLHMVLDECPQPESSHGRIAVGALGGMVKRRAPAFEREVEPGELILFSKPDQPMAAGAIQRAAVIEEDCPKHPFDLHQGPFQPPSKAKSPRGCQGARISAAIDGRFG